MENAIKFGVAGAVGVAALEYLYTTDWYQKSSFAQAGAAGGIAFDMAVAGGIAALVGYALHKL